MLTCKNCDKKDDVYNPWNCPNCKKETCENCFSRFGLCHDCGEHLTDEEAINLSEKGGWDWSNFKNE